MANPEAFYGRVRVAVVDDDADTREFLKDILQSRKNFTFAGGFSSGTEALAVIPTLNVDLTLMDIRLSDMDGIECTRQLKRLVPSLKVVIVSGNREQASFDRSVAAGAVSYLIKPVDPDQLTATLRFLPDSGIQSRTSVLGKESKVILNLREQAVLAKLAEGLLYKEISDALGISYTAVHKCQHRIFRKLQVSNRSEAIRIWLRNRTSC